MKSTRWNWNAKARAQGSKAKLDFLQESEAAKARGFHKTSEAYSVTPLANLSGLAAHLGVSGIYVKDESYRFGLNAFKVLGGAYAMGQYLAKRLNTRIEELSFEQLKSEEVRQKLGDITFITATDGNHGRGVAWAAQQLGQKAVVYMPEGSSQIRLDNIKATGAEAYITEWNYDECVRFCAKEAEEKGWVLIQDTAWDGYQAIPEWIMQGYATLASEAYEQLRELGVEKPSHILLQAGVGSFAGSVQGFFASVFQEERPVTVIVEPDKADCLFKSAEAGDGEPRYVTGRMDTIMAGLACGEPNPIAWEILRDYADMFISCPDYVAALGMRMLGNPIGGDPAVISGESGAVTLGMLSLLLKDPALEQARQRLGLDESSRILLINTEGDTDPEHYRRVVWEGLHPSYFSEYTIG